MGQDPNFHISVPSGWAKLGNIFHIHICPMHYSSHDRPLNSAAFMWLSPISIILLFKNNIFLFVGDFQLISKIILSSMIVLMKCNCNNTRGYQFWLDVSISWKKSSNYNKFRQKCPAISQPLENVNAFCAHNIDVIKTKFGQKLQHTPLYQLIFTYCWYKYYLSC